MRALRLDSTSLTLDPRTPAPSPGPGEALLRTRRIGVSATDLAAARGASTAASGSPTSGAATGAGGAITLGHEFVGVVEQVNIPDDAPQSLREKRGLKGCRVIASPGVMCGACDMCRSGLSPHCRHRAVAGLPGPSARNGCIAELVCLPVANLHVVPDTVDDDAAVFAYPLACALHAAQLARAAAKSFIAVLAGDDAADTAATGGAPLHALLIAHALSRHNPSTRLLTRNPAALSVCEKWGLKHRPTPEAGRRQDQDVVVECSATAAGLRLAMQFVRPRGTIVLASPTLIPPFPPGVPLPETPARAWSRALDLTPLLANEVTLVACRDAAPGASEALHALQRGDLDTRTLITRRFKLDDAIAALRAAAEPSQFKVVIDP